MQSCSSTAVDCSRTFRIPRLRSITRLPSRLELRRSTVLAGGQLNPIVLNGPINTTAASTITVSDPSGLILGTGTPTTVGLSMSSALTFINNTDSTTTINDIIAGAAT